MYKLIIFVIIVPTTTLYPLIDPELISTFYDPTDLYIHLVPIYYPIKGEYDSVLVSQMPSNYRNMFALRLLVTYFTAVR